MADGPGLKPDLNRKKHLAVILGTRPEIIKLAPVILELKKHSRFRVTVLQTGQHKELAQPLYEHFGFIPDIDLELMKPGQSLAELCGRSLLSIESELGPGSAFANDLDGVIVQGDTLSCMAGSIWGFLNKKKVFHVEAGLRTHDLTSPWPEEFNRRVTAVATSIHFAPTQESRHHLLKEGIPEALVHVVGNTVIDSLLLTTARLRSDEVLRGSLQKRFLPDPKKKMILVTTHRRESFGEPLESTFRAIRRLADQNNYQVILPLHKNPVVVAAADKILKGSKVQIIEPLGYVDFVYYMECADLILSDSGGVQEEAPYLGKTVLVLRESSERPEALTTGYCHLVGTDEERIFTQAEKYLQSGEKLSKPDFSRLPFGEGDSAKKILKVLEQSIF